MIKANEFVEQCLVPYEQGWGYIWGKYGQTWTAKDQARATRPLTKAYGAQWIGKRVTDCSGLIRRVYEDNGLKITHSSHAQYLDHCRKKGKLINGRRADGYKLRPGTSVYLYNGKRWHHVGVYTGDGIVVEAAGTRQGVILSNISKWDYWGELKEVDYSMYPDEKETEPLDPVLRKGDRGNDVQRLQQLLNQVAGAGLKADGIFGDLTEAAVMAWQREHRMTADGVCGPVTWASLRQAGEDPERPAAPELPEDDDEYDAPTVVVPLSYVEAVTLRDALKKALAIIEQAFEA